MQSKTTRAFRTISEAAEELDLQPHVLRFWESKFPNFRPIKRGGGRRFYRPEDIEFLRGIKILLHDERHPIKDVQKLIRVKGANRVVELGRSIQKASIDKDVKDTDLVPDRIKAVDSITSIDSFDDADDQSGDFSDESFFPENQTVKTVDPVSYEGDKSAAVEVETPEEFVREDIDDNSNGYADRLSAEQGSASSGRLAGKIYSIDPVPSGLSDKERSDLELALNRLLDLRKQWGVFKDG